MLEVLKLMEHRPSLCGRSTGLEIHSTTTQSVAIVMSGSWAKGINAPIALQIPKPIIWYVTDPFPPFHFEPCVHASVQYASFGRIGSTTLDMFSSNSIDRSIFLSPRLRRYCLYSIALVSAKCLLEQLSALGIPWHISSMSCTRRHCVTSIRIR